jgi:GNAT superfamily N-acetyltransferase
MINFDLHPIVCRPALWKDTEQVLELSSHIWDGGDYIPKVWEDWLKDPDGLLGVAEIAGRVAGTFKLTKFADEEWYLEGLRVHPDFQERGVAAHIHDYVIETWHRMGRGVLRLTTASYNVKVHHMCERTGFKRIAEFISYRAPILLESTNDFTLVGMEEVPSVFEFVNSSPMHSLSSGLINLGWVYANPQIKHIEDTVSSAHAWWWRGRAGFLSIWEDDEEDTREPGIELLACQPSDLPEMLADYRRLMGMVGYDSAGWVAPNQPQVIGCLEGSGFVRNWDVSLYIFELRSGSG